MTLCKPYGRCALNFSSPSDRDFVPRSRRKTDSPVAGSTSARNANSSDVTNHYRVEVRAIASTWCFCKPFELSLFGVTPAHRAIAQNLAGDVAEPPAQLRRLELRILLVEWRWAFQSPRPAAPCGAVRRRGGLHRSYRCRYSAGSLSTGRARASALASEEHESGHRTEG